MDKNVKSLKRKSKAVSTSDIVIDVQTSNTNKTKLEKSKLKVIPTLQTKLNIELDSDSSNLNQITNDGELDVNMITPEDFSIMGRSRKKNKSSDHQVDVPVKKSKNSKLGQHSEKVEVDAKEFNEMESCQKNKLKYLNDEEAEVKDEDIDEFCEDLDEEANSQYENWVKLIEAKLHSKKK